MRLPFASVFAAERIGSHSSLNLLSEWASRRRREMRQAQLWMLMLLLSFLGGNLRGGLFGVSVSAGGSAACFLASTS